MLIKFYRSNGQHLGDYQTPSGFPYDMGGPYRMPDDAPKAALEFKMFNVVEDLGWQDVGRFVPARKALVVEN